MADEIKLKAPTVEQQVVVNINGEDKLKSFADTLDKISNNKNLQKYWKTQQDLINATADAYSNFQKKASKDNASELIKVTNALKAMSGTDLSNILPDFDKISKSMTEAQKVAGNIDSAFSVKGFKEAFDSFETLKAYGTDIQKLFSHFGVSSDIGELQQNVRLLEGEVEKLTRRLVNARNANEELRNELENFKVGSGFADKLDELDRLKAEMQNIRDEATQTFNQFLDANKIDRYDWFSDDRFAEYFEKLENGTLTATDAIRRFKSEYSYLLEDSYKSSGDSFGLDQLQAFSTKLDSIFHQVEETSNKINDIISNGVIAKSVQNLSEDTALSDSQRSIFGNILQDEESLKSITSLFQKLIDETNQTKNTEVFNTEQFTKIESLFTTIESSLSSIKGVLVDVGDGEELSPLLKTITNVESGIDKLSSSVKGIGLNMNIDFGSDKELEAKAEAKISNALQAYQNLFEHIKMSGAGGSVINTKFFDFDINQFDTPMSKLQAYIKFIKDMREEAKQAFGNQDVLYTDTDKKFWDQASSAKGQVTKIFNEIKASTDTNPLENIFGKTDLSGVIEQLNTIVSKLDEISNSAKGFTEAFKDGLNVNASVEEIEKLTNRVKELEDELAKIKTPTVVTPQESNISLGDSSTVSDNTEIKANSEVIASIEKKKQELASYELQLEETRYEIEKLSKTENEAYGFKKAYSNMNDKYINSRKESLYNSIFGTDKSKGQGSMKYQTMNLGGNVEKGYAAWREELERLGYTLSELRKTNIGVEADIIPIDGKAITNAEEFRKALFGITSIPSDNIKVLNQQISELESKISSLKSEISSLESVSNNLKKDTFPDKDASASVKSATNSIKEENNVLEQNTQKVKENTQAKEQNANANLNKYDKRLDSYNGKVDKYQATIDRFKDGGWTSDTYLKNVQAVRDAVKQYATLLDNIKTNQNGIASDKDIQNLDKYEKKIKDTIATVTNMSASEKGYSQLAGQKEIDKINKILRENSAMSSEAKAKIKAYKQELISGNPSVSLEKIHGEIMKIVNAEELAGRAGRSFFDTLKNSRFHQIAAQMAGMFGIYDVINIGKQAIEVVTELDSAFTEMRKVSDETTQSLKNYQKTTFDTANDVGTTAMQIQNSTADWQRLGYSLDEASELAKNSNIYKNVGDMDIDEATEHMISSVQAWKSEFSDAVTASEEIMNRYNKIGNEFAISSADIGEAMETSAAALKAGGNDLNESIGLVTAGNLIQQDASTTASAMKILSLRIRGAKADLDAMGESTDDLSDSTSKMREELKALTGVDIMKDENTFKSTAEIIQEMGKNWNKLTDVSKAAALEKLAGKNRASTVSGLIENYETIGKVIEAAENSENSALEENEKYLESIEGRTQKLTNQLQELASISIKDDWIKGIVSGLTNLLDLVTKLVDKFGTLPTIAAAIAGAFSLKNVGIDTLVAY